ncbi:MAG: glycosyltransferase [Balneolaceae bacterium]
MKNVLFIVYYFPPMGGSGVQRPLKFVKYLRDFGWNPIILCPEPGAYHTFDDSLQEELDSYNVEVHRVSGNTPFHSVSDQKKEVQISDKYAKILRWFSTLLFIPDNKKKWIKPGLQKALYLIENNNIEIVFSSAPPYSNLMLADLIKQKTGLPVVMDLRDDWLESHLINYPTSWHKKKMKALESDTLGNADVLLTINEKIAESISSRTGRKVEVIGHGYDPEDFDVDDWKKSDNQKIKFLYSGSFYPDSRPDSFLRAIHQLLNEKQELRTKLELQFQGGLNSDYKILIKELGLQELVLDYGYVNHAEAVENLMKADILWLNVGQKKNPEIISLGKTSEYFATRKPILGLVPDGSAKEMLKSYGNTFIAAPYDIPEIKRQLIKIFDCFEGDSWPQHSEEYVTSFDRKKLAGKLSKIFNAISPS